MGSSSSSHQQEASPSPSVTSDVNATTKRGGSLLNRVRLSHSSNDHVPRKIELSGPSFHPMHVAFLSLPDDIHGNLGITLAPSDGASAGLTWFKDKDIDLHILKYEYNCFALVARTEDYDKCQNEEVSFFSKAKKLGINVIPFPSRNDQLVPEYVVSVVSQIVTLLRKRRNVIIHCSKGIRMGGVLSCCILLYLDNTLKPKEVISEIFVDNKNQLSDDDIKLIMSFPRLKKERKKIPQFLHK